MFTFDVQDTTTSNTIFNRLKPKIERMVRNYRFKLGVQYISEDELMAEARYKFYQCFPNYDDDESFIKYLAKSIKHRIIDMKKEMMKFSTMHFSDLESLPQAQSEENSYNRIFCEMAVDNNMPDEEVLLREKINSTSRILEKDLHRAVFFLMIKGLTNNEIATELEKNCNLINQIKREHVWPAVKEIFQISDKVYNKLTETTRARFDYNSVPIEELRRVYADGE